MVKHSALLSMTRLVLDMSSPATNARLIHVEIVEGRPFGGCHGKASNHGTEVQSECVSFLDSKQVVAASDTVQQEIVAPGSYYPLYSATQESEGNEIVTVIVQENFHEYILHGKYSRAISSSALEYAFMASRFSIGPRLF